MPARAPPSIDMLQTVMRPSIDSARMASPAYSMTWPVPPAVPISPMIDKHDVLGGDAGRERPVHGHAHVLGLLADQRLGGEHMLDLGRADAVGERPEGAVGRGVAVAAHDRRARQGEALLGTDDVDDALPGVELVEILDAEIAGVLGQRLDLGRALGIVDAVRAVGGRHVVVDDGQRLLRVAHAATRHAQPLEGLRARHLMDEVAVDVEQACAIGLLLDDVVVPDLVVERAGGHRDPRHEASIWDFLNLLARWGKAGSQQNGHIQASYQPMSAPNGTAPT